MDNYHFSQAIEFLNSINFQDKTDNNLSKLIRKKFPHWPLSLLGLVDEQSELRKKAEKKFKYAQQMIFTRKGLEQSTSEEIARFTASLFKSSSTILDVCAGIGGNSIGLQSRFSQLTTIEPDALLNAIHAHNLNVYFPTVQINRIASELNHRHLQEYQTIFIDPDRRAMGKRSYSMEDHAPDIQLIIDHCKTSKEIMIKLSPMINADQTAPGFKPLYIADEMELKQNLWLGGELMETPITFAILHNGKIFDSLHLPPTVINSNGDEFIYELNPAIIKAGEAYRVAQRFQLQAYSETNKHFLGPYQNIFPFASCWKILAQEPFHPKKLTALLQSLPFERFEIKPFGIEEAEVKKLINKWGKGQGKAATVFIFKQKDFKQVIVGEKL